jgi:hypothetical protein
MIMVAPIDCDSRRIGAARSRPVCSVEVACLVAGLLVAAMAGSSDACQVPVFRYALERWEALPYTAAVFHRGPLKAAEQSVVDYLTKASQDAERPVNLEVKVVDLAGQQEPQLKDLFERAGGGELPRVLLLAPRWGLAAPEPAEKLPTEVVLWSGRLDRQAAERLVDSPKRREIARRLLTGDSAVWILLETGDRARDEKAEKSLSERLKKAEEALKQADEAEKKDPDAADGPPPDWSPAVPVRIGFSIVRLARKDLAEEVFVSILTAMDPKLKEQSGEPIAFPVFGRGRVLGALPQKQMEEGLVAEACEFLTGECSCQVKDSQPGSDLLMAVDWEGMLEGRLVVDKALPPLTGVMPSLPATEVTPATVTLPAEVVPVAIEAESPMADPTLRNVLITVLAVLGVAAAGTLLLRRPVG